MKDYSIIQTNGTLYLEVTDGNGLGGKTTRELKTNRLPSTECFHE